MSNAPFRHKARQPAVPLCSPDRPVCVMQVLDTLTSAAAAADDVPPELDSSNEAEADAIPAPVKSRLPQNGLGQQQRKAARQAQAAPAPAAAELADAELLDDSDEDDKLPGTAWHFTSVET